VSSGTLNPSIPYLALKTRLQDDLYCVEWDVKP